LVPKKPRCKTKENLDSRSKVSEIADEIYLYDEGTYVSEERRLYGYNENKGLSPDTSRLDARFKN
jgi:hypothetical protein